MRVLPIATYTTKQQLSAYIEERYRYGVDAYRNKTHIDDEGTVSVWATALFSNRHVPGMNNDERYSINQSHGLDFSQTSVALRFSASSFIAGAAPMYAYLVPKNLEVHAVVSFWMELEHMNRALRPKGHNTLVTAPTMSVYDFRVEQTREVSFLMSSDTVMSFRRSRS